MLSKPGGGEGGRAFARSADPQAAEQHTGQLFYHSGCGLTTQQQANIRPKSAGEAQGDIIRHRPADRSNTAEGARTQDRGRTDKAVLADCLNTGT
jgi:hypothetical protein